MVRDDKSSKFKKKPKQSDNFKANGNNPLVLADFGTGDGGLALRAYNIVLACGIQKERGVTVLMSTQDFFTACCPPSYIDVSMSHLALQYVGSLKIENELFYTCNDVTDTERKLFKEQMQDNWRRFLATRSRELKPGGRVFVSFPMSGLLGDGSVHQVMSDTWRYLSTTGIISLSEFKKATVSVYYPTKEDTTSVFVDSVYSGLKLLRFEHLFVDAWWNQIDSQGQPACSPAIFAKNVTSLIQSYTRYYIEAVFNESESRSSSENQEIVDTFYRKTQDAIEKKSSLYPILTNMDKSCYKKSFNKVPLRFRLA